MLCSANIPCQSKESGDNWAAHWHSDVCRLISAGWGFGSEIWGGIQKAGQGWRDLLVHLASISFRSERVKHHMSHSLSLSLSKYPWAGGNDPSYRSSTQTTRPTTKIRWWRRWSAGLSMPHIIECLHVNRAVSPPPLPLPRCYGLRLYPVCDCTQSVILPGLTWFPKAVSSVPTLESFMIYSFFTVAHW